MRHLGRCRGDAMSSYFYSVIPDVSPQNANPFPLHGRQTATIRQSVFTFLLSSVYRSGQRMARDENLTEIVVYDMRTSVDTTGGGGT
jgi:hypothetical protein